MRKRAPLWLAVLCLWCAISAAQDTSCRLAGSTVTPMANGVLISLQADGTMETAVDPDEARWDDRERIAFDLPNMRGGGAASMVDVDQYPVSHLEFTPLADTKDSVGLRCTIVLTRAARLTAFTGEPYDWDDSGWANRAVPQVMIRLTQQCNVLYILVLSDKNVPPDPQPLPDARSELHVHGTREAVSLNALNAEMTAVADALGTQTGAAILVSPTPAHTVSAHLDAQPLEHLLATLARAYGMSVVRQDGAFYLVPGLNRGTAGYETQDVTLLPLRYLSPAAARNLLPDVLRPYVQPHGDANTLAVSGAPEFIAKIRRDLVLLDQPVPQCRLRAWVVSTDSQDDRLYRLLLRVSGGDTAVDAESEGDLVITVSDRKPEELLASLTSLARTGVVTVHAMPSTTVANGQWSEMFAGKKVYYWRTTSNSLSSMDAGSRLRVTPRTGGEWIMLDYEVFDRILNGWNDLGPLMSKRSLDGTVRIRSGETLIIGGLLVDDEETGNAGTPRRRHLPIRREAVRTHQNIWVFLQAEAERPAPPSED